MQTSGLKKKIINVSFFHQAAANAVDQTKKAANDAINKSVKAAEQVIDDKMKQAEHAVDETVKTASHAVDQKIQETNQYVDQKRVDLEKTLADTAQTGHDMAAQQAAGLLGKLNLAK